MPICLNSLCIECHLSKRMAHARELGTEEQAMALARKIMDELIRAPADMDSAWLGSISDRLMQEQYGLDPNEMQEEKDLSNRFVLDRLDKIRSRIQAAEDPIYAALQFSVLGNYLDFSALRGEVSFEDLEEMLEKASEMDLDKDCYRRFRQDLSGGKKLLYITDNAGEIVFDRVLAELLQQTYPDLQITFCVRGKPVSNDATREDAKAAGITFPVIDNGSAIGGTVLRFAGEELKQAMDNADVILAKGMGNTESLYGCGYNVYYAFLVKCTRFVQFFDKPKMTPMFVKEK